MFVSSLAARRIDCLLALGSAAAAIARAKGAAISALNSLGAAEQDNGAGRAFGWLVGWNAFIQNKLVPTSSTAREMVKTAEERIEAPNA